MGYFTVQGGLMARTKHRNRILTQVVVAVWAEGQVEVELERQLINPNGKSYTCHSCGMKIDGVHIRYLLKEESDERDKNFTFLNAHDGGCLELLEAVVAESANGPDEGRFLRICAHEDLVVTV